MEKNKKLADTLFTLLMALFLGFSIVGVSYTIYIILGTLGSQLLR